MIASVGASTSTRYSNCCLLVFFARLPLVRLGRLSYRFSARYRADCVRRALVRDVPELSMRGGTARV